MVKLTAPLLSLKAKGRIGKLIVFYGEGYAREWSTQVDPQTGAQLQSRAVVKALMQMVKKSDGLDRAWLRKNYAESWHTKLVAWCTRNGLENAQALHAEWMMLDPAQRAAWEAVVPE